MSSRPVIKLKIDIEYLDAPDDKPYLLFVEPSKQKLTAPSGKYLTKEESTWKKVIYDIHEIRHPQGATTFYAVQDKDLFDKVLLLANSRFDSIIQSTRDVARSKGRSEGFDDGKKIGKIEGTILGASAMRTDIRNLSWWKRLLNRF